MAVNETTSHRFGPLNDLVEGGDLSNLTGIEAKVWLVLFRHLRRDGTTYAPVTRIARVAGIPFGKVQKSIRALVRKQVIRQLDLSINNCHVYSMFADTPANTTPLEDNQ